MRETSRLLIFGLLGLAPASLLAQAVVSDDAHTNAEVPTANYGAKVSLSVALGLRAFIRFDLSSLPPGTTGEDVAKATLTLSADAKSASLKERPLLSGPGGNGRRRCGRGRAR